MCDSVDLPKAPHATLVAHAHYKVDLVHPGSPSRTTTRPCRMFGALPATPPSTAQYSRRLMRRRHSKWLRNSLTVLSSPAQPECTPSLITPMPPSPSKVDALTLKSKHKIKDGIQVPSYDNYRIRLNNGHARLV
jgi:hypothetical protein